MADEDSLLPDGDEAADSTRSASADAPVPPLDLSSADEEPSLSFADDDAAAASDVRSIAPQPDAMPRTPSDDAVESAADATTAEHQQQEQAEAPTSVEGSTGAASKPAVAATLAAPKAADDTALENAVTDAQNTPPSSDQTLEELAQATRDSFLLKPAVQNWLPIATSVVIHLAIILVAVLTFSGSQLIRAKTEEQIIVPDAAIVEGADVGGIPNPGLGGDPTRSAAQDVLPDASQSQSWADKPSKTVQAALVNGGETEQQTDTMIGLGSAGTLTKSPGAGPAGSNESGGDLAPFGVPGGGGGVGPQASFVGISGNARRVVYICDATGTMIGLKYQLLKKELYKALDILKPIQGFNIIFFKGGETDADWANPFARELIVANPSNKQKARTFIENFSVIGSGTNPLPALKLAFAQNPQLVYFLTDGQFDNVVSYQQVMAEVRALNPDKKVKLNTIAFLSEDAQAEKTLADLARENGGKFAKVTERDLE